MSGAAPSPARSTWRARHREPGEQVLAFADALRHPRRRAGQGPDDLAHQLTGLSTRVYQQLLRQPLPDPPPTPEDERRFEEQWAALKTLPEDQQEAIVQIAPELRRSFWIS
jgi:DNA-directed RNA polymerase specialized sigma24 family protein